MEVYRIKAKEGNIAFATNFPRKKLRKTLIEVHDRQNREYASLYLTNEEVISMVKGLNYLIKNAGIGTDSIEQK